MPKPLSGKEIIRAAQEGTPVLYVYAPFDIHRSRCETRAIPIFHNDMEAISIEEDTTGFWWEVSDLEGVDNYLFDSRIPRRHSHGQRTTSRETCQVPSRGHLGTLDEVSVYPDHRGGRWL